MPVTQMIKKAFQYFEQSFQTKFERAKKVISRSTFDCL